MNEQRIIALALCKGEEAIEITGENGENMSEFYEYLRNSGYTFFRLGPYDVFVFTTLEARKAVYNHLLSTM